MFMPARMGVKTRTGRARSSVGSRVHWCPELFRVVFRDGLLFIVIKFRAVVVVIILVSVAWGSSMARRFAPKRITSWLQAISKGLEAPASTRGIA
jgi:hypothetical protein